MPARDEKIAKPSDRVTELNPRTPNNCADAQQNRLKRDRVNKCRGYAFDDVCHLDQQHEFFEGIAQRTNERQRNAPDPTGFDSRPMGGKACRQYHLEPGFPRGTRKVDPV